MLPESFNVWQTRSNPLVLRFSIAVRTVIQPVQKRDVIVRQQDLTGAGSGLRAGELSMSGHFNLFRWGYFSLIAHGSERSSAAVGWATVGPT
ncbi:MAG: hypothetical protein M3R07_07850 [Gemmatimonadota bacterium]|nr:hypothetical protein [Gemmatimonadota bacterium]